MPRPSRRTFLKAAGGLLLVSALPAISRAGLLDRVFGHTDAKATEPIMPNDEFYVTSYLIEREVPARKGGGVSKVRCPAVC